MRWITDREYEIEAEPPDTTTWADLLRRRAELLDELPVRQRESLKSIDFLLGWPTVAAQWDLLPEASLDEVHARTRLQATAVEQGPGEISVAAADVLTTLGELFRMAAYVNQARVVSRQRLAVLAYLTRCDTDDDANFTTTEIRRLLRGASSERRGDGDDV